MLFTISRKEYRETVSVSHWVFHSFEGWHIMSLLCRACTTEHRSEQLCSIGAMLTSTLRMASTYAWNAHELAHSRVKLAARARTYLWLQCHRKYKELPRLRARAPNSLSIYLRRWPTVSAVITCINAMQFCFIYESAGILQLINFNWKQLLRCTSVSKSVQSNVTQFCYSYGRGLLLVLPLLHVTNESSEFQSRRHASAYLPK